MSHIKVSVIVPVYRVERYLDKCLNSLVCQDLEEMEILAVNDGSPDSCQSILERFQQAWPQRIRIFQKENGGLSDARNFGLERAEGEYLAFLDSDDWVDPHLYRSLYRQAEACRADLVACPIRYVWEDGRTQTVPCGIPPLCENEELKTVFTRFYPAVWNKLYHRSLLEKSGARFKKGAWFEDVEFSHRLFPYVRRAASIETEAVNYLQREGSVTAKPDLRLFDYLSNFQTVCQWFDEKNLRSTWEKELEYAACRYLLATFLKRAAGLPKEDYYRAIDESLSFLEEHFPAWRHNPYFRKNGLKGLYLRFFSPRLARFWGGTR